jgi:hypothetical protein
MTNGNFTRIKGISDKRRLPRLGKIRLGIKKVSKKTGKEYPAEAPHFVCPPEVKRVYGEKPTELDIVFPVENPEVFFPQSYKAYGSDQRLKCKGDGETAIRLNPETGELEERDCPCEWLEENKCSLRGHLMVLLPRVSMGGVYQIDTGSYNNIVNINSYIDYLKALVGRVSLIPLKLRRVEQVVNSPEGKARKHYLLQLELPADFQMVAKMRQEKNYIPPAQQFELEAPKEEGPEPDTPIELVEEEEIEKVIEGEVVEESQPEAEVEDKAEKKPSELEKLRIKAKEMLDSLDYLPAQKKALLNGIKSKEDAQNLIEILKKKMEG